MSVVCIITFCSLCFVGAPVSGRVRRLRRDPVRGETLEHFGIYLTSDGIELVQCILHLFVYLSKNYSWIYTGLFENMKAGIHMV